MIGAILDLISAATSTVDGAALKYADRHLVSPPERATLQAVVTGDGAVAATVVVQGSHDGTNWVDIATIELSGTDTDSDGFSESLAWKYVRARVTAISGTDAAVTVTLGF